MLTYATMFGIIQASRDAARISNVSLLEYVSQNAHFYATKNSTDQEFWNGYATYCGWLEKGGSVILPDNYKEVITPVEDYDK